MTLFNPFSVQETDSEGQNQKALFAYLHMVRSFGLRAANEERCYIVKGLAAQATCEGGLHSFDRHAYGQRVWQLDLVHAIPNGAHLASGARGFAVLRSQGVRAGVWDINCPVPVIWGATREEYCGLWVEMKDPAGLVKFNRAKPTDDTTEGRQQKFGENARKAGHMTQVCVGWKSAAQVILDYLGIS